MPGIVGMATTFNCPNYVGDLFAASPEDTPLLSAIGGLTGGVQANATIFTWQGYDLRDAEAGRQRLEGANAPQAEERARFNVDNVVEIHQETVDVSYTKEAAVGQFGQISPNPQQSGVSGTNPVADELRWQIQQQLKQIARDIEKSFIVGKYANPGDNTTPRKTRGLMEVCTDNKAVVPGGGEDLSHDLVYQLVQQVWERGGLQDSRTATFIVNAWQKRRLSDIFIREANYQERSRNVGGVNLTTIQTDFGEFNIMLNRYMPKDSVLLASLDQCAPAFLPIPNKGFMFSEPLGKTSSSDRYQIYGEIGLRYGNPNTHGVITGLTDAAPSNGGNAPQLAVGVDANDTDKLTATATVTYAKAATLDWGDGSAKVDVAANDATEKTHKYAAKGDKTVTAADKAAPGTKTVKKVTVPGK